ncbi:hypothetical protein TNCV_2671491 [Trichonephila clavipes]|nr:hypothetical protein TNCV_2671491 [Trichonephila clavipes]
MGSPHMNKIVITAEIKSGFVCSAMERPGSILLHSSFLLRGTSPNGGVDGWASRAAHVMDAAIPNVLQPGAFIWQELKLIKILSEDMCGLNSEPRIQKTSAEK